MAEIVTETPGADRMPTAAVIPTNGLSSTAISPRAGRRFRTTSWNRRICSYAKHHVYRRSRAGHGEASAMAAAHLR